jgi:hypothetical protein
VTKTTRRVAVLVSVLIVGVGMWLLRAPDDQESAMSAATASSAPATSEDLALVARSRVFFGHQSVGMNILDAVPAVYAAHGLPAPPVFRGRAAPTDLGSGFVLQDYIGQNEDPTGKIRDFEAAMRSGTARQVQVAAMKLCYVDFRADTDVETLFATYRTTMEALERDFPGVVFVKITVPLTTERGLVDRIKGVVRGTDRFGPAENVRREEFNALLRQEYTGHHLFDLAELESTAPDGHRVGGDVDGDHYFSLYPGYAADAGHLNAAGARRIAAAWLHTLATALQGRDDAHG